MAVHLPTSEVPTIVDYGNAPEFYIDGLAHYSEDNLLVRMSFYAHQPVLDGSGTKVRVVVMRLVCPVVIEREMRAQIRSIAPMN